MRHSWIGPSKIAIVMKCTGSLYAQKNLPEMPEKDYQKEGKCAHSIAASTLGKPENYDTHFINDEMIEGVKMYVNYIRSICGNQATIEETVFCTRIHAECFGTPDAWYYDQYNKTLHVFDFKYGRVFVNAFENWQLLCYASGIADKIGGVEHIVLHIVQPRAYSHTGAKRTWRIDRTALDQYLTKIAFQLDKAINDPVCTTGAHCKFCNAFLECNAGNQAVMNAIDMIDKLEMVDLTPARIATQFMILDRAYEMIRKQHSLLEEIGLHEFKNGNRIPGLSSVSGKGTSKWTTSIADVLLVTDALKIDVRKPQELKTPLQAISAGVPKNIVDTMSKRTSGKLRLKIDDMDKISQIFEEN